MYTEKDKYRAAITEHWVLFSKPCLICTRRLFIRLLQILTIVIFCGIAYSADDEYLIKRIPHEKPTKTQINQYDRHDQIIIKFSETTKIRFQNNRWIHIKPKARQLLGEIVKPLQGLSIKRLFSRSESQLETDRKQGQARSGRELADLNLYFELTFKNSTPKEDVEAVIDALNRLEFVEISYPTPIPQLPSIDIPPTTPDYQPSQGYRLMAPSGVNADYAASLTGGTGLGARFIDIEYGWRITHEDLKIPFYAIEHDAPLSVEHGTAILGEIIGQNNGFGVTGIAPDAEYGISSISAMGVASSINESAAQLSPGDVILIPLQTGLPKDNCSCNIAQCGMMPIESVPDIFDAIATATSNGVIVVEAAGNGSVNLDDENFGNQYDRSIRDSGAILVAASVNGNSSPTCWTNHGMRIDARGWGSSVYTTGYGTLFNGAEDPNQYYTASFSGTSSASPMVAGAVLALQGRALEVLGHKLTPLEIRTLLTITGTPQFPNAKVIGPLPDLFMLFDYGLALDLTDLDNDAVPDILESGSGVFINGYDPGTEPNNSDTDNDGLLDGDETYRLLSNPVKTDSDDDGMPDGWEFQFNLLLTSNDSNEDKDTDGLTNLEEFNLGSDPLKSDTDGDRMSDYDEVILGTDPLDIDTDDDGMPDQEELDLGLNPLYEKDLLSDWDNDGVNNYLELARGTDPYSDQSIPLFATWYVDVVNGDPNNNGASPDTAITDIGSAVILAQAGDTIIIAPGEYSGPISINKPIIIRGPEDRSAQISGYSQVIISSRNNLITIAWGELSGLDFNGFYPIDIINAHNFTVRNVSIHTGLKLRNNATRIRLQNSVLRSIHELLQQEALILRENSSLEASNLTIADSAVGLSVSNTSVASISNTIIYGNDLDIGSDGELNISYSLIGDQDYSGLGTNENNITGDPLFIDSASGNYQLAQGSPALGSGSCGSDMGAFGNAIGICLINPGSANPGDYVYLNGSHFCWLNCNQPGSADLHILIGDIEVEPLWVQDNYAYFIVPENASSAPITVQSPWGKAQSNQWLYIYSEPIDSDGDGIPDNQDNCPVTFNPTQNDSGGVDSNSPDGIGNACQCGDISGDGKITNTDSVLIKRHLLGLPSSFNADFCDVSGDGQCTNTDAVLIQRSLLGLPPGLSQTCTASGN